MSVIRPPVPSGSVLPTSVHHDVDVDAALWCADASSQAHDGALDLETHPSTVAQGNCRPSASPRAPRSPRHDALNRTHRYYSVPVPEKVRMEISTSGPRGAFWSTPYYSDTTVVAPPPYTETETETESDLPSYTATGNPPTLARLLFTWGFLFPPLWLLGTLLLLFPPSPPPNWEPHKSTAERTELLQYMRRTEVRWARRCLVALCVLCLCVAGAVLVVVVAVRPGREGAVE